MKGTALGACVTIFECASDMFDTHRQRGAGDAAAAGLAAAAGRQAGRLAVGAQVAHRRMPRSSRHLHARRSASRVCTKKLS